MLQQWVSRPRHHLHGFAEQHLAVECRAWLVIVDPPDHHIQLPQFETLQQHVHGAFLQRNLRLRVTPEEVEDGVGHQARRRSGRGTDGDIGRVALA
ncbi:hypothetical protein D9M69_639460 [compost metagenome]